MQKDNYICQPCRNLPDVNEYSVVYLTSTLTAVQADDTIYGPAQGRFTVMLPLPEAITMPNKLVTVKSPLLSTLRALPVRGVALSVVS